MVVPCSVFNYFVVAIKVPCSVFKHFVSLKVVPCSVFNYKAARYSNHTTGIKCIFYLHIYKIILHIYICIFIFIYLHIFYLHTYLKRAKSCAENVRGNVIL